MPLLDKHKQLKYKRILFYWMELQRNNIDSNPALEFMSMIFHVEGDTMLRTAILKYDYEDFDAIPFPHIDLDIKVIEGFIDKINAQAKKERRQYKLEL